jgi:glycosyltransferase involved in cell wall biosynthesis
MTGEDAITQRKLKVLVADTAPLYPPLWGGPRRIYDLFSNFESSAVRYVGLNVEPGFEGSQKALSPGFSEIIVAPDKKCSAIRKMQHLMIPGLTFDLYSYFLPRRDTSFSSMLKRESEDSDVLIASHVWSFPCMARRGKAMLVYDAHNVEHELMRQVTRGRLLGGAFSLLVKRLEGRACRQSDLVITCSEEDKQKFLSTYGLDERKVFVVPNTTDTSRFKPSSAVERMKAKEQLGLPGKAGKPGKVVLFIGSYYTPNIEAMAFIARRLAPRLPHHTFIIAGSVKHAIGEHISETELPSNVRLVGSVSDDELGNIFKATDIAINPVACGSGIHIKMLDYMASGLPIVTTPIGARGLGIVHKRHAMISGLEHFHDAILEADRMKENLGREARQKSLGFDSKKHGRILENLIISKYHENRNLSREKMENK